MSFKDILEKKLNLSVRDVKEAVADLDILALMNNMITNKLIKSGAGDLTEKVSAQVVTKKTNKVTTQ